MNIFKDIRHPSIIITLLLSIAIASLIIHLVSRVTNFSERVTDFYAPTIHAVKDFEKAVSHIVMGIENKGFPEQVALHHFKTATKTLMAVADKWEPAYRKHIEEMLKKAKDIDSKINNGIIADKSMLPELKQLHREALHHVAMHDAELKTARAGIKDSAIGKIAVSDAILRKEGRLNDAEWHEMKTHPISTANVLKDFDSLKEIIPWALYHHERFDGRGYPEGKSGTNIPLPAQIIAIADAFDAMTSARPYRPAMSMGKALSEIENNRGIQWHSDIVDAFMQCIKNGNISL